MEAVVSLVFHLYESAPEAVKVVLLPLMMDNSPDTVTTGVLLMVKCKVTVLSQPLALPPTNTCV